MIDLISTIKALRLELQCADQANGNDLDNLYVQLKTIIDFANQFERLWVGGWARVEYNHYQNPNNQNQNIQVNEEYFYDLILKRLNLDVEQIGQDITKLASITKKLQKHIITELSIIRDEEGFNNEIEL